MANHGFDKIGKWREVIHPPPPRELAVRLDNAIAVRTTLSPAQENSERIGTHKVSTNENKKENISPAISAVGHIEATDRAIVV